MIKTHDFDIIVIGGGAAGMSAAVSASKTSLKIAIIEREDFLGGILHQCIHNGFGLHTFKEELTGPEFAERFEEMTLDNTNIEIFLQTTAIEITSEKQYKIVSGYSEKYGVLKLKAKAIILAMGCRERNRGNIGTGGDRPSGLFTAGLAQRLINIDGLVPGKKAVIIGSGDIGLIMARRLSWTGAKVLAVIEINTFPAGLTRNIVQCLNDFDIPLYLGHMVTKIFGRDRVEKIEVTPLLNGNPDPEKKFYIKCDTLLFSVGLIPDTQLIEGTDVRINHDTNGPYVDNDLMTEHDGIFACGNVLHVHDIVDFASEEASRCGEFAASCIKTGFIKKKQFDIAPGSNIKYVIPNKFSPLDTCKLFFRSMIIKNDAVLYMKINNMIVIEKKIKHVQPSEMISITLNRENFKGISTTKDSSMEVSLK